MKDDFFRRVLIVGYGSAGQRHLRITRSILPNADIRLLRHKKMDSQTQSVDGCFFSYTEAAMFAPNIAIIANPSPFHVEIATLLAKMGAHILIEKPISNTSKGVLNLIQECQKSKTILMVGYNLRCTPSLNFFRKQIYEGVIGEVISVRIEVGRYLPDWRHGTDYRSNVSARKVLGGGVNLELSHEIDYLNWIFGEAEWVQAFCGHQSKLELDVEDTSHIILGFYLNDRKKQLVANVSMDFVRHDPTRLCTAIGEYGTLRWNGINGTIEIFMQGAKTWSQIFEFTNEIEESYISQMKNFLLSARNGNCDMPLISGYDGLRVIRVIEAIQKSSTSNGLRCYIENDNDK